MSSWRWQIMRHIDDNGEPYLKIHEAYKLHDGKFGWTEKAVPIEADNLPAMRMALLDILRDLERHGVKDAKTGEPIQPAGSASR